MICSVNSIFKIPPVNTVKGNDTMKIPAITGNTVKSDKYISFACTIFVNRELRIHNQINVCN